MFKFSVMLAGALMVGCAATAPRDWKRMDENGRFSLDAPVEARRLPRYTIDTYSVGYATRGLSIQCDDGYNIGCWPDGQPTTVSGHPASIRIEKAAKRDTIPYRGTLCILSDGRGGALRVSVGGKSKKQVLRVLRSVSIP